MKRLFAYVLTVVLFGSSSLLFAEPPKPIPILPTVEAPTHHEPTAEDRVQWAKLPLPTVAMQVSIVKVPDGFRESLGLVSRGKEAAVSLTCREAKLLAAVLKSSPEVETLSRPQLVLTDKQKGTFQVGQSHQFIVGPLTLTKENGEHVLKGKTYQANTGITMTVTPSITDDGKSMKVTSEFSYSQLSRDVVQLPTTGSQDQVSLLVRGEGKRSEVQPAGATTNRPGVSTVSQATSFQLADGETILLSGMNTTVREVVLSREPSSTLVSRTETEKPYEILLVIKGQIVSRGAAKK